MPPRRCRIVNFVLLFAVTACAPTYDGAVTLLLASVRVAATEIGGRCPSVTAADIHASLVTPLAIAGAAVEYRPDAIDVTAAIGEISAMAGTFEDAAAAGKMSAVYCRAKAADVAAGADAVLRGWEGL